MADFTADRLLRVTVSYRTRTFELSVKPGSTLRELGQQLHAHTGAEPQTIRLLLPHGGAFTTFSGEHAGIRVEDSGIVEGRVIKMMGVLPEEVKEVSREAGLKSNDRIIGFVEEEIRAKQRLTSHLHSGFKLPTGRYIFCDFRTLELPGIVLDPPPQKALEIMHKLASDPGIVSIMNKYHWRVGVMTEMAPIGYVGISPKCLLGYNKNFGEEISLRIRTDDLKGFRKYESIKRTLLHELAHMIHSEHDAGFYVLNKQLNEEAISLDWTKSKGRTSSDLNYRGDEGLLATGDTQIDKATQSYTLGGSSLHEVSARSAAAAAALNRFSNKSGNVSNKRMDDKRIGGDATEQEADPDEVNLEGIVEVHDPHDIGDSGKYTDPNSEEFEGSYMKTVCNDETDSFHSSGKISVEKSQQDSLEGEPDSDEINNDVEAKMEPDPDEMSNDIGNEIDPVPDEIINEIGDKMEPDLDEIDNKMGSKMEPDPDEMNIDMKDKEEPDPDDGDVKREAKGSDEPDPDDPDDVGFQTPKDSGVKAMEESSMFISTRLQQAITKLKEEATSSEFAVAILTLVTILRNVMEHPYDGKYKCLRKENSSFQSRVAKFQGALEVLHAVGFSERPCTEIGKDKCLVLSRNDPGLIWLARSLLETCMA